LELRLGAPLLEDPRVWSIDRRGRGAPPTATPTRSSASSTTWGGRARGGRGALLLATPTAGWWRAGAALARRPAAARRLRGADGRRAGRRASGPPASRHSRPAGPTSDARLHERHRRLLGCRHRCMQGHAAWQGGSRRRRRCRASARDAASRPPTSGSIADAPALIWSAHTPGLAKRSTAATPQRSRRRAAHARGPGPRRRTRPGAVASDRGPSSCQPLGSAPTRQRQRHRAPLVPLTCR